MKILAFLKTNELKATIVAAIVYVAASCYTHYSGNTHTFYADLWQYVFKKFSYAHDIYIQHSFVFRTSIAYWLFPLIGLDLDNDNIGFPVYILLALIGCYFTYRIARNHFGLNPYLALAVTLPLCYLESAVLRTVKSGYDYGYSDTPSSFANAMMYPLFWLLLQHSWIALSLLAALMLATAVKIAWMPVSIAGLYSLWVVYKGQVAKRCLWWLALPVAVVLLMAANAHFSGDFSTRQQLFALVLRRDTKEDAFHLQGKFALTLFSLSVILFLYFIRQMKAGRAKQFVSVVWGASVAVAIIGGLYGRLGQNHFPYPQLILLSPVRAMAAYQYFFFFLVMIALLALRVSWLLRLALIVTVYFVSDIHKYYFVYNIPHPARTMPLVIGLLLGSIAADRIFSRRPITSSWLKKWLENDRSHPPPAFVLALLFFLTIPVVRTATQSTWGYFDEISYADNHRWFTMLHNDPDYSQAAVDLRKCNDFILVAVKGPRLSPVDPVNNVAGKSRFLGDYAHFYFNLDMYKEYNKRTAIYNAFQDAFTGTDKTAQEAALKLLKPYDIVLLASKELLEKMPITSTRYIIKRDPRALADMPIAYSRYLSKGELAFAALNPHGESAVTLDSCVRQHLSDKVTVDGRR